VNRVIDSSFGHVNDGGEVGNFFSLSGNAVGTLTNGTVQNLRLVDNSSATITNGTINNNIELFDNTSLESV